MSDNTIIALVALSWIVCGVITYGRTLAFLQREYPTLAKEGLGGDQAIALLTALFGPVGLIVSLLFGKGHGLMWRAPREESKDED